MPNQDDRESNKDLLLEASNYSSSSSNESFYETPFNSPNQSFENDGFTSTIDENNGSDLELSCQQYQSKHNNQDDCESHSDGNNSSCDSVQTLIPNQENTEYFDSQYSCDHFNNSINQPYLITKLKNIAEQIRLTQIECSKIQMYEQQLMDLGEQLKNQREKLMKENYRMIQSLNELILIINGGDHKSFQSFISSNNPDIRKMSTASTDYKYKLRKLPAMVKGYLVRRLMATVKVKNLKRTIKDTSAILINFKQNLVTENGQIVVTQQDVLFHKRLCIQLEKSCKEFYSVFFNTSIKKKMQLISNDRKYLTSSYHSSTSLSSISSRDKLTNSMSSNTSMSIRSNSVMSQLSSLSLKSM